MDKTIEIIENVKKSYKPNLIRIYLNCEKTTASYSEAIKISKNDLNVFKNLLNKNKLSEIKIFTENFSINEEKDSYKDKDGLIKYKTIGFTFNQSLRLDIDFDSDLLGLLLDLISKSNIGYTLSLSFDLKDKETYQEELYLEALKKAKNRAEISAETLGVKLKELVNVEHENLIQSSNRVMPLRAARNDDFSLNANDIVLMDRVKTVYSFE